MSNHSVAICHRMSPTVRRSRRQGMGLFGEKFVRKGLTDVSQNFNTIWERHGAVSSRTRWRSLQHSRTP